MRLAHNFPLYLLVTALHKLDDQLLNELIHKPFKLSEDFVHNKIVNNIQFPMIKIKNSSIDSRLSFVKTPETPETQCRCCETPLSASQRDYSKMLQSH